MLFPDDIMFSRNEPYDVYSTGTIYVSAVVHGASEFPTYSAGGVTVLIISSADPKRKTGDLS